MGRKREQLREGGKEDYRLETRGGGINIITLTEVPNLTQLEIHNLLKEFIQQKGKKRADCNLYLYNKGLKLILISADIIP